MPRIDSQLFAKSLGLDEIIKIADIGASAINEMPIYKEMVANAVAHLCAFDGDARHIPKLKSLYGSYATILDDFLGDGEGHTVYICGELISAASIPA